MYWEKEDYELELLELTFAHTFMATVRVGREDLTVMVDLDFSDSEKNPNDLTIREIKQMAFDLAHEEVLEEQKELVESNA